MAHKSQFIQEVRRDEEKIDLSRSSFLSTSMFSVLFFCIFASPVSNTLTMVSLMLPLDSKLQEVP